MANQVTLTLTLPNGKRKYFRGATKKEAERKRDEAKRQLASGIDLTTNPTVEEFTKMWLAEYKEGVVRDTTYLNLVNHINNHILPELGRLRMREVRPAHIQRMVRSMEGLAKSSQSRILTVVKEIFKTAVENDVIAKTPCISSIKPRGEEPEEKVPLTSEQEKTLLDKARGTNMYLFVLLGLSAGLRHGELLGLEWKDIDLDTGMLTVQRTVAITREKRSGDIVDGTKTDAAHRTIPLPWSVIEEVRAAKSRSHSVYVIPGPKGSFMTFACCAYRWNKLFDGLDFRITPHRMRHTRITRWFEQGLDLKEIQYLAGHADIHLTLDVYTHYQESSRLPETAKKIRAV